MIFEIQSLTEVSSQSWSVASNLAAIFQSSGIKESMRKECRKQWTHFGASTTKTYLALVIIMVYQACGLIKHIKELLFASLFAKFHSSECYAK